MTASAVPARFNSTSSPHRTDTLPARFTGTSGVDVDAILASLPPELNDPGEDPWGGANLERCPDCLPTT